MPGNAVRKGSGSYLSLLKPDETYNVIRHLSARPKNPDFISYISPIDAYNVVRSDTALAEPLRKELAAVGLRSESRPGFRPPAKGLLCETETPFKRLLYEMLLGAIGPTMERMSIDFCMDDFHDLPRIVRQCSNLKSLHITSDCDLRPLLNACAGKLTTLDLSGYCMTEHNAKAIAQNCSGLKSCKIVFQRTKTGFNDIWITIAPTVEDLAYNVPYISDDDEDPGWDDTCWLDAITDNCKKVTKLAIGGTQRSPDKLLRMCQKMGKRLKLLRFLESSDTPSPRELKFICDVCPDVRFDAAVGWDGAATLKALGGRCVSVHAENRSYDSLEDGPSTLKNVERVHIKVIEYSVSGFVDNFFAHPFIHLRSLWIQSNQYEHDLDMLDVIATHVTTVVDFRFSIHAFYQGSYGKFVAANQGLKNVHIEHRLDGLPENNPGLRLGAEFEALGVIKDFSNCPKLEVLTLHNRFLERNSSKFAEACIAMGRRNVDVFIGGTQYRSSVQR